MTSYTNWYARGSDQLVARSTAGQAGGIKMEVRERGDFGKILKGFEWELREKALVNAMEAAGKIVARRAKQEAPDSRDTGYTPREKKKKYAGTPHLKDTMTVKVSPHKRKRKVGMWVGPSWPAGAHGNLVEGFPKATRHHAGGSAKKGKPNYWTGGYNRPNPFLQRAVFKTKAQQNRAIMRELLIQVEQAGPMDRR